MRDLALVPSWLWFLALPVPAFLLLLVWLLTRRGHSSIKVSGFGMSLVLTDETAQPESTFAKKG